MTTTKELVDLIESGKPGTITIGETIVRRYENGVINIDAVRGELTPSQMDAFRTVLAGTPYYEKESWIATTGMSWLSNGMRSVSMKVAKR